MFKTYWNNYLFSEAYVEKLFFRPTQGEQDGALFKTISDWLNEADFSTFKLMKTTFVEPILDTMEFARQISGNERLVYLYSDFSYESKLALVLIANPDSDLSSTIKGDHWSQMLISHMKEEKIEIGFLTNGRKWRIYNLSGPTPSEVFFEVDLPRIINEKDYDHFRAFIQFFSRDSYLHTDEGMSSIQNYLNSSKEAVEQIEKHLNKKVETVLEKISMGFVENEEKDSFTEEERAVVFENSVYLLYRILFILYAESRELLPINIKEYNRHSLKASVHKAIKGHQGESNSDGYEIWNSLFQLCTWIDEGYESASGSFIIPAYNGGLFDNATKPYFSKHKIKDTYMVEVLYYLTCLENESFLDGYMIIDYRDLSVRHLGSLYEGLLEYKLFIAEEEIVIRIKDKTEQYIPKREAGDIKRTDVILDKGHVYFSQSKGERKSTGSYYTPEEIVDYNVKYSVTSVLNEKWEEFYINYLKQDLEEVKGALNVDEEQKLKRQIDMNIKEFIEKQVLTYRVCDPAMGSGHFLVNAVHAITNLIVEKLNVTQWKNIELDTNPVLWRRRVVERCIFGVDVNNLAVELAKLSLWITAADAGKPLSYLDHHLKEGNSLTGARLKDLYYVPNRKKQGESDLFSVNAFSDELKLALKEISKILEKDTDDIYIIAEKKLRLKEVENAVSNVKDIANLWMSYHFGYDIDSLEYYRLFDNANSGVWVKASLEEEVLNAIRFSEKEKFFHWEIEFPEVFINDDGFDATIGNPPWEIWKPNSQEFFEVYIDGFRSLSKQEANKAVEELLSSTPNINMKWVYYEKYFSLYSNYYLESGAYPNQTAVVNDKKTGTDINLYKLFSEKFYQLLKLDGKCSIVIPSGIYTDQGTTGLRNLFFNNTNIHSLYCFENRKGIFSNVHRSFKFVTLNYIKGHKTESIRAAFFIHDVDELLTLDERALFIPIVLVKKFAPDTLSVMEPKTQRELELITKIYRFPLLGETINESWNIRFTSEFHMTNDSDKFSQDSKGLVLYEGKMIHQYTNSFSEPKYWMHEEIAYQTLVNKEKKRLQKEVVNHFFPNEKGNKTQKFKNLLQDMRGVDNNSLRDDDVLLDYHDYRIGFRDVAASTNERSLISTILPPNSCAGNTLPTTKVYQIVIDDKADLSSSFANVYYKYLSYKETAYLTGVFNSFVIDYIIRNKITNHLNLFLMYQLPIARLKGDEKYFEEIIYRVGQLCWTSNNYDKLALELNINEMVKDSITRQKIKNEIDAYVAKIYLLSKDELEIILSKFPAVDDSIKDGVIEAFETLEGE